MTTDERLDRMTGILDTFAGAIVVHDRQIEAHDRRIEALRNAGGSNPRNISHHPADDLYPAWSRDGYKIGFASASDRDGNLEIYPILAPR